MIPRAYIRNFFILLIFFLVIMFAGKIFPAAIGTLLCLVLMYGYYFVILRGVQFCNVDFLGILKREFAQILFAAALGVIFIVIEINSQQTIYIWDSLETWEPVIFCEGMTFTDPFAAVKTWKSSINHSDYNNFLPMLMVLPAHIFGKSFLHYVLYVWLMFGLPAIFLISAALKTFLENCGYKVFPCAVFMAIFMLFPIFEVPLFIGYANVSILLPGAIILIMLLNLKKDELQKSRLLTISLLSIFAVFQARTAAYMIVGCFAGYTVYLILSSYFEKNLRRDFLTLCKKFLFIGVSAVLMMLPLFFSFLKKSVTYDYGTAYSAYALGMEFSARILDHAAWIGFLMYGVFFVAIILGLFNKKLRAAAALIFVWLAVAVILFCRVQLMGWQHFYIMILPFGAAIAALIAVIFSRAKILSAILAAILILNFAHTFGGILPEYGHVFNKNYELPVRYEIADMKNFVEYLNGLTAGTDKKIFLLASGSLYNSTTLQKIYIPEKHVALPNLLNTADVDLRDGFPVQFFDADFVVIATPPQVHLRAEDQSVVVKTAEFILKPSPISARFKLIEEFKFQPQLAENSIVTFKIYEKISPLEKSDIEFAEKVFDEIYPNNAELFKNRFENYAREHFGE